MLLNSFMSALGQIARAAWNAGLGLIYPEVCQLCGEFRASPSESFVCQSCRDDVRWIAPPFCERCGLPFQGDITVGFECFNCQDVTIHFSKARSSVVARNLLLLAIHRYKYGRTLCLEPFLAELFLTRAVPELAPGEWSCVVPVPLYGAKRREREFNQAERLGRHLARALHLPLRSRLLRRVVPTQSQTRLSRQQRAENVKNAFALSDSTDLAGERIILVDDVLTTGATTNACARVLVEAGAAEVCVWTVARGL
jgi:ComF family protein